MSRSTRDDPRAAIKAQQRRIAIEAVPLAVTALMSVCADKNAPAPARATAGTSLLRAAGMFDRKADPLEERDPSEMSAEELAEAIRETKARRDAIERGDDEDDDVFG
ncbi:MAG: hypothetical protein JWL93_192 [Hyphomicrobiales bacterium]|nr:hypothetical protein [Hyphomicrobiales bacterium]